MVRHLDAHTRHLEGIPVHSGQSQTVAGCRTSRRHRTEPVRCRVSRWRRSEWDRDQETGQISVMAMGWKATGRQRARRQPSGVPAGGGPDSRHDDLDLIHIEFGGHGVAFGFASPYMSRSSPQFQPIL
jgi:hypothetical protein